MALRALLCVALVASGLALPQGEGPHALMQEDNGHRGSASLVFDASPAVVNPGQSLSLECGVQGELRLCTWRSPEGAIIQSHDVHSGLIPGISKPLDTSANQCGIVLDNIVPSANGPWRCEIFVVGNTLAATKNVTVTVQPAPPRIDAPQSPLRVAEDTTESISCIVSAARPKASIQWFLEEENLTLSSQQEDSVSPDGTVSSISTLSQTFKPWHDKKSLRCEVSHVTLQEPEAAFLGVEVLYKPHGRDVNLYGLTVGQTVEAKVNFSANPSPLGVKWGYAENFADIFASLNVPGEEGSFTTEIMKLDNNRYTALLRIVDYQLEYSRLKFKIAVTNDQGTRDFQIVASSDTPPAGEVPADEKLMDTTTDNSESEDPMSSSAIAAIVIVALLLLFIIIAVAYTMYYKLYCFAPKKIAEDDDKEVATTNETESSMAPAPEKLQKISFIQKIQASLKKNKKEPKEGEDTVSEGAKTEVSAKTDSKPEETNGHHA